VAGTPASSSRGHWTQPASLRIVYQPIVSTLDGRIRGVEALARFPDGRPPDVWFREAAEHGAAVELELLAVETALGLDPDILSEGSYVAVNVSPVTLQAPQLLPLVRDRAFPVVVEITEHSLVGDYVALASAVTDYAKAVGSTVIAEGVETMEEYEALVSVGIRCAQGYLFAKPAALPIDVDAVLAAVRQPRVLVVDDDAAVRTFIRLLLDKSGFEIVAEADDVSPAIGFARAAQPDVIVLDVQMPSMRGDEALPMFRRAAPDATIVVVSGETISLRGPNAPDAYVPKGIEMVALPAVLRDLLRLPPAPDDVTEAVFGR
jgi:EAL domain-containing protein (putative c-di-GMP-specific phosphodiesterase class I)/CheY-like chemotaxis protein